MNVLNQPVLVLNRGWQPIGETTVERALVDITGNPPSKLAMHVELETDGEGSYRLGSGTRPCSWEEWITLEVRDDRHEDRAVHTHRFTWRAPTVLICTAYDKMPARSLRWSTGNVRVRDNGVCQVSGRRLARGEGNVGHLIARAKGGRDDWTNTVYMDKQLNSAQGTKTVEEMGWKLIRKPVAPPALPVSVTLVDAKHVSWIPFLLS